VLENKVLVEATLKSTHNQASFLAASTQRSRDWLFALPSPHVASKLDDEAARAAVGLIFVALLRMLMGYTVLSVKEPARRKNTQTLTAVIFLSRLQLRHLMFQ